MNLKRIKRYLTLLEVMIVIAILAIAGGTIFWRLNRLVEAKRFEADGARLHGMFLSTRMLAINTKSDWELQIEQDESKGWQLRLLALEEPGKQIGCGKISALPLRLGEETREFRFRFSSTGQVTPHGVLELGKKRIDLPSCFRQQEGDVLGPVHPDDLR